MPFFNFSINLSGTTRQTNIAGISPEQLATLVRQHEEHSETQKKLIARLETDLELNNRQVREALRILGEKEIPNEQLLVRLVEIAHRFASLRSEAAANPDDDWTVVALKLDVQKAIDAGDLAGADALLEKIAAEQRRISQRSAISLAETLASRAAVALTRLRYREAAEHFSSAAAALPFGMDYDDRRIFCLGSEAHALHHQGLVFGDNEALLSAVVRWQRLLSLVARERVPLDWAGTQHNLGNTLQTIGNLDRHTETEHLEQAVTAYRAALQERTRERVPLDWAGTLNNLSNTLAILGDRKGGTELLAEAVAGYREALKERTRDRFPLDWAETQNNICNALKIVGRLEGGTERLVEAVAAYREALKERTRERVPLLWAATQNNLGQTLLPLGCLEGGTERLKEAVAVLRAALEEQPRERVPVEWARTHYNLGATLSQLGEREGGTERLVEAVAAYREALKERTRERIPHQWARVQYDLGNALQLLGARESGTERLEEAATAYRAALEEWTATSPPREAVQGELARCLSLIAQRRKK